MRKMFIGFLAVCAVTAAMWSGLAYMKQKEVASGIVPIAPSTSGSVPPPPAPPTEPPAAVAGTFKNGTYVVDGSYSSPAGQETVGITLILTDDVITAATAEVKTTNQVSKKFQGQFTAGFATQVIGKKLSEVTLEKVSGSSLTPKGFNDAVLKIKAEAKAS